MPSEVFYTLKRAYVSGRKLQLTKFEDKAPSKGKKRRVYGDEGKLGRFGKPNKFKSKKGGRRPSSKRPACSL